MTGVEAQKAGHATAVRHLGASWRPYKSCRSHCAAGRLVLESSFALPATGIPLACLRLGRSAIIHQNGRTRTQIRAESLSHEGNRSLEKTSWNQHSSCRERSM